MNLVKVRMTRAHNGFAEGETVELEYAVADAFVNWARAAEFITEPVAVPATEAASDKAMRSKGGKRRVVTK